MQNKIKINGIEIFQPEKDLSYNFETTFSEDSNRTQNGVAHFTPLFTVEQLGYSAKDIPVAEASKILQMVAKGKPFNLYYFSTYYGKWREGKFRVGKGSLSIGTLKENKEVLSSLTFNMTGENPL